MRRAAKSGVGSGMATRAYTSTARSIRWSTRSEPDGGDLTERAGLERAAVDLERWSPAIGRVREDVVDDEIATGRTCGDHMS